MENTELLIQNDLMVYENDGDVVDNSQITCLNEENSEKLKIESFLQDCCISCLTQENNLPMQLKFDRSYVQIYKEFVDRHIETKIKEIPIAFCDGCCEALDRIKNFKTSCLQSLSVLEELISQKRDKEQNTQENEPLQIKMEESEDESDDDLNERSSDEEFIPDFKTESKEDQYVPDDMNLEDDDDELQLKNKRIKRSKKDIQALGKNRHICKECGKSFPRPANLRNHFLKKHRGAKHCKYCQKAFENEQEFAEHMQMEEKRVKLKKAARQKIHVCEICGLSTRFRSNLVKHMDTHLPDPNAIKCEVCGKGFKSRILLKNHIGYHKEKTFVCEEPDCDKKFLFGKDLERHIRLVHLKAAEYTNCSICGKRVTTKGLNSHVKQVHMDLRPHICNICGQAFKSSSNIKKHMYSHSGTRPFNCHLCGQGTYMTCTLKDHYNKVHGMQLTNSELNKICIKLPPGPIKIAPVQQTIDEGNLINSMELTRNQ